MEDPTTNKFFEVWILNPSPQELLRAVNRYRQSTLSQITNPLLHRMADTLINNLHSFLLLGSQILEKGPGYASLRRDLLSRAAEITLRNARDLCEMVDEWNRDLGYTTEDVEPNQKEEPPQPVTLRVVKKGGP